MGVLSFLAALQAITTEAGGDEPMLQELSQKVAEAAAAGGDSVATSSDAFQLRTSLEQEASPPSVTVQDSVESPPAGPVPEQNTVSQPESPAPATETDAGAPETLCPPDPAGGPYCLYTVQDGDTLWGIAEQVGFEGNQHFSGAELLAMSNDLNDAQNWVIVPGQELRVPSGNGIVHPVEESQTVSVLAELYGVTTADVISANPAIDPNNVIAGSELLIPSPSQWPVFGPFAVEEDEESGAEEAAEAEEDEAGEAQAAAEEAEQAAEDAEPLEAQPTGEGEGDPESSETEQGGEGADGPSPESTDDASEPEEGSEQENASDETEDAAEEAEQEADEDTDEETRLPSLRSSGGGGLIKEIQLSP